MIVPWHKRKVNILKFSIYIMEYKGDRRNQEQIKEKPVKMRQESRFELLYSYAKN